MARIIQCDRCEKTLPDVESLWLVQIGKIEVGPTQRAVSKDAIEVCDNCAQMIYRFANERPPQTAKYVMGG